MKRLLDSSFFFADYSLDGELFTTPSVVDELVDLQAKCRFENLLARGLTVVTPSPMSVAEVDRASRKTGDSMVLSGTDRELLAAAHELNATLYTDDFAVQNVAHGLGVPVHPLMQRRAAPVRWRFRCSGCGKYYENPGECPVCGAVIKRKLK
jgi:UPF0271 protein